MFKQRRRSNGKKGSNDGRGSKKLGKLKSTSDTKKQKDSKIRNRRLMKVQRLQIDEGTRGCHLFSCFETEYRRV